MRSNIRNYIQKQIFDGRYLPGDRIVETRLARELNVSQAPVREAILELSTMGILEERPYSGTYVCELSLSEIEDIFETRAFFEEYAARRAAKRATEEQLARMEKILCEMDEHRDLDSFVRLDMDFHELVVDAAASPSLKRAWRNLRMAEWTYLSAKSTESSVDELIEQHRNIFRYLKNRDESSAGAYMVLHIKNFGAELVQYLRRRNQQDALKAKNIETKEG